jgi:ABC-type glycerol-3-phosphate transport system substrate-binding protein
MIHSHTARRLGLVGAVLALVLGSALIRPAATRATAAAPVTITFWNAYNKNAEKELKVLIPRFEAANPGITVNEIDAHSYNALLQKEQAAIFAGNPPVMGQAYEEWVAGFLQSNAVAELTPFINGKNGLSQSEIADFFAADWADGLMPNGKRYMMPSSKSDIIFYYNPDILKAAGISSAPQTWDQFAADAVKVTKVANGRASQWGLSMAVDESNWYAFVRSYGSQVVTGKTAAFDNAKALAPVLMFRDLIAKKAVQLVPSTSFQDQNDFTSGRTAMYIGSSAGLSFVLSGSKGRFTPVETILPAGPAGRVTELFGAPVVLFAKASTAQQEAAWALMKWLTEPAQTAQWAIHTGYMPVRQSALDLAVLKAFYARVPGARASVDSLPFAVLEPPLVGWAQSRDAIQTALEAAFTGRQDAKAAMAAAAQKVNSLLAGGH